MSSQCGSCAAGNCTCGCCEGVAVVTPIDTSNPPGLSALQYRVGTHATFLESMIASLTLAGEPQLQRLGTRASDDPAIALLDGWATVADILTFYQERIANEGYLRTAVERRSVLELARLIGYRVRPGVASSVHLAYTIDDQFTGDAVIPVGTRSTSVPGPGEQQQTFETSEELKASASWNVLRPRQTRPQTLASIKLDAGSRIYLQGVATNLKTNDPLLLTPSEDFYRVNVVTPDTTANRTLVTLLDWSDPVAPAGGNVKVSISVEDLVHTAALFEARSVPPANARQMTRSLAAISPNSDSSFRLFDAFQPESKGKLVEAVRNAAVAPDVAIQAYTFRAKAALFGASLPGSPVTTIAQQSDQAGKPPSQVVTTKFTPPTYDLTLRDLAPAGNIKLLALDGEYDKIAVGSFLVVDYPMPTTANPTRRTTHITTVAAVETRTLSFAGGSSKSTLVTLSEAIPKSAKSRESEDFLRGVIVWAQSELLPLAEEPIPDAVCGDGEFELDDLYTDLEPGRWLIMAGERADIPGTSGVQSAEILMLSEVRHGVQETVSTNGEGTAPNPGDKTHTFIKTAKQPNYCYKRDTLNIYANVVHATHGETRRESLGGGDAAQVFQQFALKQTPLTYISAPTATGVESTLQIYVNDVEWHESEGLAGLGPTDRQYITKTSDDGKTTVIFGDGVHGARTPTGLENLRAIYRNGIGKPGNVLQGQISQLGDRPLGVSAVVNPLAATGGADAESRDQARRNAPLATTALDRLVSTQDYADFARTFAGVGKASAAELPGPRGTVVHVTIAGLDDIPIAPDSDLFRNLKTALVRYGDPVQPVMLAVRGRILLVLSAGVKIMADYVWEKVEPKVRAAVLNAFSFDARELGQTAFLSEAIAAMQAVEGVEYVDVDSFGGVPGLTPSGDRIAPSEIAAAVAGVIAAPPADRVIAQLAWFNGATILPAQVAYFAPDLPDTLVLNEVKL